jgi:hypothetical protein
MVRGGRLAASLAGVAPAPAAARTAPGAYANPISHGGAGAVAELDHVRSYQP